MSLCSSGIIMAAFTSGLLLSDIMYSRGDRLIPHAFLGGIATALFFILCQNGYEMVNWGILLAVPVYIIASWILHNFKLTPKSSENNDTDDCPVCKDPPRACGCPKKKRYNDCPAKPIEIPIKCGITKYKY